MIDLFICLLLELQSITLNIRDAHLTLVKDDEVVLQCSAMVHKEQQKLCLAAEGFGNRLCFLESTSNSKNVPPDLSICTFVLEQSLSVRALQEMLANTEERAEGVSAVSVTHLMGHPEIGDLKQTHK
ncbi:hypothetical protein QQF64_005249, partial [Cirrhinus molitorella]